MRYTIYKITNTTNGKYYIGKHQTENPNDRYFGSGKAIKDAIKLHGKAVFVKEILHDFDTEAEMNAMEIALVNEALVADRNTYNMTVGGEGGAHFKGRTHSAATRKLLAEHQRGKTHAPETLGKLRGRALSPEHKAKIAEKARTRRLSAESKAKIAASVKSRWDERKDI